MRTRLFALFVAASTLFAIGCGSDADPGPAGSAGGASAGAPAGAGAPGGGAANGAAGAASGGTSNLAGAGGAPAAGAGGAAAGAGGGGAGAGAAGAAGAAGIPDIKVVAYLPSYSGSFASWATKIDFNKMTHLNLAFATIKDGTNDWNFGGAKDADVTTLVDAAHAKGVKVLVSLGGAAGDISIINRYHTASNIDPMVVSLDALVTRLNLDGVDVDIERGNEMKSDGNFGPFVDKINSTFKPKGKLVTSALAQYVIQAAGSDAMVNAWLNSFDFINLMIYSSNMNTYTKELAWWSDTKAIPKKKLTVGVGFYGGNTAFKDIMAADPTAWSKNSATVNGKVVNYAGVDMMKMLATTSKGYGGIMIWELSQDVTGEHSLWKAIQDTM